MLAESTAKSNSWNPDAISICEFICAGDKLIVNDAIRSYALGRKWMKLINQYGPTETHVVMSHSLSGDPGEWPTEPPIGLPISGVFPSIRERNGESVETGELVIEGKCVAAGYVGATSQDESRFSEFNRSRSYSTGDCVSTDEFGVFQFLGRLDRQIKLRGHRIEPDGIESVLESLPGVLAAAVDIFGEDPLTRKLVAVVVSDEPLSAPSIRRQLGKIFPPYSVPNEIRITPALPKSSSGKVDHQALIQLEFPFEH
jgi:acyl-coenzyme A synthetase/AMP-(fatty) acid ligase